MKIQLLMYLAEGCAWEPITRELIKAVRQPQMTQVQHVRMTTWEIIGRAQLVEARESKNSTPHLKEAKRIAARLEREKRQDTRALAALLRAGIANCKGDLDKAKQLLEVALPGLAACELGLFAASARRRLGQLLGGDQGKALIAEADRWMTMQGIRNPARMTAVYAPGFADP